MNSRRHSHVKVIFPPPSLPLWRLPCWSLKCISKQMQGLWHLLLFAVINPFVVCPSLADIFMVYASHVENTKTRFLGAWFVCLFVCVFLLETRTGFYFLYLNSKNECSSKFFIALLSYFWQSCLFCRYLEPRIWWISLLFIDVYTFILSWWVFLWLWLIKMYIEFKTLLSYFW